MAPKKRKSDGGGAKAKAKAAKGYVVPPDSATMLHVRIFEEWASLGLI